MLIRKFGESEKDFQALHRLHFQLSDKKMDCEEFKERLLTIIADRKQVIFLAEMDGEIIGYVAVFSSYGFDGKYATIAGLVVDKDHKRQGIGKELMNKAEEWANRDGASLVKLRSAMTRANEAHKFYQNIGYEKVKEQACFEKKLVN